MKIPKGLDYLFKQTGAANWLTRSRAPKPAALFLRSMSLKPTKGSADFVYADEPGMLRVKEEVGQKLTDEFPRDVLPSGFAGPTAVPGDFYATRNMSGCGMDPIPIPLMSNDALIKANGLAENIRKQDEPWLDELIKLFFGHAAPADLHIRKEGSTSFPFFTKDIQYKKLAALKILKNVDSFLNLAVGKTRIMLTELLDVFHAMFLFAIHERQQPNQIVPEANGAFSSKPRTTPTEAEARDGSYTGKTVADMRVRDKHGNVIEGHFAMRRRDVFGMNGPLNYAVTAIIGCFRAVYLNRFAFTYKTRDREDKRQKISRFTYVLGSDVKTMDKLVPRWFIMYVCDKLPNYLDERVVEVMKKMYMAPYVCPPPWVETPADYNPIFGGDPLEPGSCTQHVGLPSGVAFNPDWGKLWMTFVYSVLYRDCGALHRPSDLEPFMRGLNPNHALLDMSDDATFLTNVAVVAKRLEEGKSPYAVLEPEKPVIYLGDVFAESGGRKEVFANPITYAVNAFCREDSIDKIANNPNAVISHCEGMLARIQTYSGTPIFRDMNAIMEESLRKHLGFSPISIARTLAKNQRFNEIDAMVKANPGVLHYKVDPATVSKEVLDDVVATIPARDFWNDIKHLFKVPTVDYEEIAS